MTKKSRLSRERGWRSTEFIHLGRHQSLDGASSIRTSSEGDKALSEKGPVCDCCELRPVPLASVDGAFELGM